jgi:Protein of unknown function (DUF3102)
MTNHDNLPATVTQSNSLADLAAQIKTYHEATVAALKRSVEFAIKAGECLLEAKAQLGHGHWLPWLDKNCTISERTAQLYMKLAKNKAEIAKYATDIADLTLNEAAALCVLAGRIAKLLEFAKQAENASPEEVVSLCVAQGFTVIQDPDYDPFYGRSEREQLDWILFGWFVGDGHESSFNHVEWLLQRPFQNVEEWLGPEGDKFRKQWWMKPVPEKCKALWKKFQADHAHLTEKQIEAEIKSINEAYQKKLEQKAKAAAR